MRQFLRCRRSPCPLVWFALVSTALLGCWGENSGAPPNARATRRRVSARSASAANFPFFYALAESTDALCRAGEEALDAELFPDKQRGSGCRQFAGETERIARSGGAVEDANSADVLRIPFWVMPQNVGDERPRGDRRLHASRGPLRHLFLFSRRDPRLSVGASDAPAGSFLLSSSVSSYLWTLLSPLPPLVPDVQLYNLPLRPAGCVLLPLHSFFLSPNARYGFKESHLGSAPVDDLHVRVYGKAEICRAAAEAARAEMLNRCAEELEEGDCGGAHGRDEAEATGEETGRDLSASQKRELVAWLGTECAPFLAAPDAAFIPRQTDPETRNRVPSSTHKPTSFQWPELVGSLAGRFQSAYAAAIDAVLPWTFTTDAGGRLFNAAAPTTPLVPFFFSPSSLSQTGEARSSSLAGGEDSTPRMPAETTDSFAGFLVEVCAATRGRSFDPRHLRLPFLFNLVFLEYPCGVAPVVFTLVESVLVALVLAALALAWIQGKPVLFRDSGLPQKSKDKSI
uniref:Uncharacterized protein n=1 Tax=Neospora caninum (strain Liverpool) TaxID=572307 RepID=A0A0F7U4T6_NEOCL|nr:TPA: hypothetical protein BN1204_000900 [Neospora caninum Liverpool]